MRASYPNKFIAQNKMTYRETRDNEACAAQEKAITDVVTRGFKVQGAPFKNKKFASHVDRQWWTREAQSQRSNKQRLRPAATAGPHAVRVCSRRNFAGLYILEST